MFKIFDFTLKLNGFPIDKAKKEYEKIIAIPENQYEEYINQKRSEIVKFHFDNNSFYKKLVGESLPEKWEDLPVLTKKDLQQPLENRLSRGYSLKNVFVNKTSGSSGDPFIFARDKFGHALTWASIFKRFSLHDIDFNTSFQARFYGISLTKKDYYFTRIKDFLSSRYRLPITDFSDHGIERILNIFKNKKFDYINGYTSCIVQVAKYLQVNNMILKDICPTLKVCIVTSEMLFEEDRKLLEKHLGIPVLNEYGSAELGVIAIQDSKFNWRLNNEDLFVEILDDQNNKVSDGQVGNIVVTSLYNKANSFIRYKVGDRGAIKKVNSKEFVLLELSGRINDFALLPSGRKTSGMTFYVLTKSIMDSSGNIKEFVIIQTAINTFKVEYSSDKELSDNQLSFIKSEFDKYLEPGLNYEFIRKDVLTRTKSGKLKQFTSLIKS